MNDTHAMNLPFDYIRQRIKELHDSYSAIHINLSLTRPRVCEQNVEATITGVYPNFFIVEESHTGIRRSHSIQYTDIYIGKIDIPELYLQEEK